jgi:hypothetical protein
MHNNYKFDTCVHDGQLPVLSVTCNLFFFIYENETSILLDNWISKLNTGIHESNTTCKFNTHGQERMIT